jgi:hypothetical protein
MVPIEGRRLGGPVMVVDEKEANGVPVPEYTQQINI